MKIKVKHIIIITLVLLILLIFSYFKNVLHLKVKVVTTEEDKKKGLMFRQYLNIDEGMLFAFKYDHNSVWMKNTYIPLDVIFLDQDYKVIGFVEDTVPLSLKTVKINKKSNYIIEVNAGWIRKNNLKIGNKMNLTIIDELS
tara:strand:- start:4567 stop:4989 length:423 start_codon:yes stop_codon:yes gene_type:complete